MTVLPRFSVLFLTVLLGLCAPVALAQPGIATDSGWSGYVGLQGFQITSDSQFSTEDDNRMTAGLDRAGTETDQTQLAPLGIVRYTHAPWRTEFFAGLPPQNLAEGLFVFELGARHQLPDGTQLQASYVPTPPVSRETWADPYVVGEPRVAVDESRSGYKVAVDNVLGSGLSVDYRWSDVELDREASGQWLTAQPGAGFSAAEQALLDRNGDFQQWQLSYRIPLRREFFLAPSVRRTEENSDGAAVANETWRGQVTAFYNGQRHRLSVNLFVEQTDYQAEHPVFDRTVASDGYGTFLTYGYKAPFGWEGWSLDVLGLYSVEDANTAFYDRDLWLLGAGASYRF